MKKRFIPYNVIRDEGFGMARRIVADRFVPTVMYVPIRGGVYLGNVLNEYLTIAYKAEPPILYAAVVAHSHCDLRKRRVISVDGWTYPPEYLRVGDKVLIVDDIFDSGATINYIASLLMQKGLARGDIRVAVFNYKVFVGEKQPPVLPDYWCIKHEVRSEADNEWFHYMNHELSGLTAAELEQYYYAQNPALRKTLADINNQL